MTITDAQRRRASILWHYSQINIGDGGGSPPAAAPPASSIAAWSYAQLPTATGLADEKNTGDPRGVQPGYVITWNGVDEYLSAPHLTGSETVVSKDGTSTVTITAGRIDFTAGTCAHLVLSDGTSYNMEEGAGSTVYDSSGAGNHATLVNGPTYTATGEVSRSWANDVGYSDGAGGVIVPRDESDPTNDVLGSPLTYSGKVPRPSRAHSSPCRVFDGVDDRIVTTSHPLSGHTGDWTMCAWAFLSADGVYPMVISSDGSHVQLRFDNASRRPQITSGSGVTGNATSSNVLPLSTWIHLAITYESSSKTFRLYEDALLTASFVGVGTNVDVGTKMQIGARASTFYMVGNIFDVRVLTSRETDFSNIMLGSEQGTQVAWYPLSETGGTTAHNVIANANHGTVNGGAAVGTQDQFHYALNFGHGGGANETPALADKSTLADGSAISNPAVIGHNAASTSLDFTSGQPNDPAINGLSIPTDYEFGDSLPASMSKRAVSGAQEDQFYILEP